MDVANIAAENLDDLASQQLSVQLEAGVDACGRIINLQVVKTELQMLRSCVANEGSSAEPQGDSVRRTIYSLNELRATGPKATTRK